MKKIPVCHVILILYIGFIFSNSLTPAVASSEKSSFVLQLLMNVFTDIGISAPGLTEHVIRKLAHFSEYTLLGILLFQSARCMAWPEGITGRIHLAAIFFIPFTDETLQLFTEGRSGQISDVWLDMSGIMCGTAIYYIVFRIRKKRTEKS